MLAGEMVKPTFLKIWSQHLRNEEFVVIDFNAWESDFSDDPFATLTGELMDGIRDTTLKTTIRTTIQDVLDEFKRKAKEIWQITQPALLRLIAAGGLGSGARIFCRHARTYWCTRK